jgi:hypothetical protein
MELSGYKQRLFEAMKGPFFHDWSGKNYYHFCGRKSRVQIEYLEYKFKNDVPPLVMKEWNRCRSHANADE